MFGLSALLPFCRMHRGMWLPTNCRYVAEVSFCTKGGLRTFTAGALDLIPNTKADMEN